MWRLTLLVNGLLTALFWLAGYLVLLPARNHFVDYADAIGLEAMPILTRLAFSAQEPSLVLPGGWLLISLAMVRLLSGYDADTRSETLQLHTSLSVLIGLLIFVIALTAGVLPYLKIGTAFH